MPVTDEMVTVAASEILDCVTGIEGTWDFLPSAHEGLREMAAAAVKAAAPLVIAQALREAAEDAAQWSSRWAGDDRMSPQGWLLDRADRITAQPEES